MSSPILYSIHSKQATVNTVNVEQHVEQLYLQLEAAFPTVEKFFLWKLKGYSKYNKTNEYPEAKVPVGPREKCSLALLLGQEEEIADWVAQGGWVGLTLPDNYTVVDIDERTIADRISRGLANEGIECTHIHTPRGYQFVFQNQEKHVQTGKTGVVSACLAKVDYRVSEKKLYSSTTWTLHPRAIFRKNFKRPSRNANLFSGNRSKQRQNPGSALTRR